MSTASDVRGFAADLRGPVKRAMVDAAVEELQTAIEAQARRAVGGDLALTGRGRLGLRVKDSAKGAVLSATGPWALVERPRRGGYPIRPAKRGGALRIGRGALYRASAKGGPITAPLRPFGKGADAGRTPALDAVGDVLDQAVSRA